MKLKNIDKKLIFIIIISIIATFNAVYLTYMAYSISLPQVFWWWVFTWVADTAFACDINATFSCSTVFTNDFAWIFWVPFSLLALFVYPLIILVAILWLLWKTNKHYLIILIISILWLLFNGYIIINEYLISTYCFLCLICTVIIIINWGISIKWINEKNKK